MTIGVLFIQATTDEESEAEEGQPVGKYSSLRMIKLCYLSSSIGQIDDQT